MDNVAGNIYSAVEGAFLLSRWGRCFPPACKDPLLLCHLALKKKNFIGKSDTLKGAQIGSERSFYPFTWERWNKNTDGDARDVPSSLRPLAEGSRHLRVEEDFQVCFRRQSWQPPPAPLRLHRRRIRLDPNMVLGRNTDSIGLRDPEAQKCSSERC